MFSGTLFDNPMDDDDDVDDQIEEEEDEFTRINRRQQRRIIIVWLDNDQKRMAHSKDPRPLYFGGEEIIGHLSIEIQGGKPVRQVKLMLINLVQIRWCKNIQTQRRSSNVSTEKRRKSIFADYFNTSAAHNDDDKQFFFERHKIIELDLLSPERSLAEGKHEIAFRFQLPKSLPSSMKSCNGLSKYTIEAFTVDDHNGHESRGEKEIILLVPNVDLMRQIERKVTHTFITNDGNNVDISVMLDRKIYQPGEMLSLSISIRNESDSPTECLVAMYQRQILRNCEQTDQMKEQIYDKCLNDSPNRDDNDEMSQAVMIPIDANSQVQDEPIQMRLPHNLVLSLDCSLITIRYYVLITINIPENNDQSMEIPFLVSITNHNHFGRRIDSAQRINTTTSLQRQISR
uniref:Arrestin domain-containing protein 3-like isoform X2 n=1 Tax=Dermatophagoides pteronyssinus TaxID=6956 RepID=A0A6P6XSB5_DERPT|nr:arrestin domain-containing protein 3-like isoform X2 [Dermatophagoides pteronyssinus]